MHLCYCFFIDVNTITINPNNGHQLGGTPVIITGPCYKETDNILCVFNNNQLVDGVVINDEEAICISPVMDIIRPVLLELYINDVAIATTTFSIGKIKKCNGINFVNYYMIFHY